VATEEPRERTFFGRLVMLSPVFAAILALWNAYIQVRLNEAEATLKVRAQLLEAQRDRVARLTFVHERLMPDVLGTDPRRRDLTVRLIRLTIPEDADSLFAGWQASSDTSIQAAGRIGTEAAGDERSALLISQLTGPDADSRKAAYERLRSEYTGNTPAITYALDTLEPSRLARLSADGRVNILLFLSQTQPQAWSADQARRAEAVLDSVQASVSGGNGSLTTQRVRDVRTLLQKVRAIG
jgi:hypothetical protein